MPKKAKRISGHRPLDALTTSAGKAAADLSIDDAHPLLVGGGSNSLPGQAHDDAQRRSAGKAAADHPSDDAHGSRVGGGTSPSLTIADICNEIHGNHTKRRYAIKLQQKIERALESFVRINETDWHPDLTADEREKNNKAVERIIKAARQGEGDPMLVELVKNTDRAREPSDAIRKKSEKEMIALAQQLPVHSWIDGLHGVGTLGLATILGEAYSIHHHGGLDQYANPEKLWKRLGFAPYDGLAGSTWKRESWRPRALTKDEWIANPFSGARYAQVIIVGTFLVNHQWIAANKNDDGVGRPNGRYGEIYGARRARTAVTHPDWTKGHSRKDAIRVATKQFLVDLWNAWRASAKDAAADHDPADAHFDGCRRRHFSNPPHEEDQKGK